MLWFPRELQGEGRHDNPEIYGCLYAALEPASAIAEALAPFRGSGRLHPSMLRRAGRPLHIGKVVLADEAVILDLDNPRNLVREGLRPSRVATRDRSTTQRQAARFYRAHADVAGVRWWSTIESMRANLTIFDRAERMLALEESRPLAIDAAEVLAAADLLGLT